MDLAKILSFITGLIVSWNIYLTIQIIETDRTQEAVLEVNAAQTRLIMTLQEDIHDMPFKVKDRYTGKEAKVQKSNTWRELDILHNLIRNHQHYHKDVIHDE